MYLIDFHILQIIKLEKYKQILLCVQKLKISSFQIKIFRVRKIGKAFQS